MYEVFVTIYAILIIALSGAVAAGVTYLFVQFVFFPVIFWLDDHIPSPTALLSWTIYELKTHLWELEEEKARHRKINLEQDFADWLQERIDVQEGRRLPRRIHA